MDSLTLRHETPEEVAQRRQLLFSVCRTILPMLSAEERLEIKQLVAAAASRPDLHYDEHGLGHIRMHLQGIENFSQLIEPDRNVLLAMVVQPFVEHQLAEMQAVERVWGDDIASLVEGLEAVGRFANINRMLNHDNYRGLLLGLAKDIRVIIIMIVRSLTLMRSINHHPDQEWVNNIAFEANFLYAQLAHRLGLYKIKGELEDLSLKYTNREIYTQIARKLNETKRDRDAYIANFIEPVRRKLTEAGLRFEIKGRTKSISSIWAKIKKQKVDLNGIYDLFAIRVIIDTPREREKADCWLAYSILADMYTANPSRMKDWISIPKSNGYESLHATVMGPGQKWVEVQFRTHRMDLVAEKGLAAHWRYKGGHSDSTDMWMNNVRDILETAETGPMQLMRDLKSDAYAKEVYVFTPKGDLLRLPNGSTVLDFAFAIHSNVGTRCVGAIVNGRHEKINYRPNNGDTIEIKTSSQQTPKQDWLSIVVTSKARNKIRQSLNEARQHQAALGKEALERRAKNRKIELDEALVMRLVKKRGYKHVNDFFADMGLEKIDPARFLSDYCDAVDAMNSDSATTVSAEEFRVQTPEEELHNSDVLVIGEKSIKGLSYKFAKCCSPIYGDNVFGFISSDGVVKIHKTDCPNAVNIRQRYPYRLISVQWSGMIGQLFPASLRIIGKDDIGIVTNITSVISKEAGVTMRNISIDSHEGLFTGNIVIGITDLRRLNQLIRKIQGVKGVKDVTRN